MNACVVWQMSEETCSLGAGVEDGESPRNTRANSRDTGRRRKPTLNAREKNMRRLESNERERMRMHSLNDAFQVCSAHRITINYNISKLYNNSFYTSDNQPVMIDTLTNVNNL